MSLSIKSLGLDRLSRDERIQLAQELWESVASQPEELELSEAQKQELDRRIDAYEKNPNTGTPWEEVLARLRRAAS